MGDEDIAQLERDGKWMELVKALGRQVETTDGKAALHLKIAVLYQDRFANLAEAIKSYERVLSHDPDHRKALDALRALYEKRRDWERLLELEKGELGRVAPEKRGDKALDVARLATTRVSNPSIQLYWWERVLEHQPEHRQAFAELTKLYAHAERWRDLAAVLRRQADAAPGNDDRAAALRKLAFVEAHLLGEPVAAVGRLEIVASLDPLDLDAKQARDSLRRGDPVDWAALGARFVIPGIDIANTKSASLPATDAAIESPPRSPIVWIALGVLVVLAGAATYVLN